MKSALGCLDEQEVLDFLSGALPAAGVASFEEHLDGCERCRMLIHQLAATGTRPSSETSFKPGELLAGRYRVVRFIAQGGMGEVYEVDDEELGERVALKTIRADLVREPQILERFKREVQLARRVTHPNVCRIFDVTRVVLAGGEVVALLTMELLDGESLGTRLRRDGPMATEAALPLVEQMAAALDASHRAGVVHRDFKSENVQLVPTSDGGTRVSITDFGLARSSLAKSAVLTGSGGFVGTPAYMAPEQVAAEEVTAAADLYALGVVMFEMVTGRLPFERSLALATAAARVHEPAPSPSSLRPGLDPRWDAAILRCLERQPARRFRSAGEMLDALRGPRPRLSRRRWRQLGVAAVLMLAAGGAVLVPRAVSHVRPTQTLAGRRAVAVLSLRQLGGGAGEAWLATALSEMLRSELAEGGQLRVIPGESVARMERDLALAGGELSPETLMRAQRRVDADVALTGSYFTDGGAMRVDLSLQDMASGEVLLHVSENGTQATLLDLVARAGTRLRARFGLAASEGGGRRAVPSSPAAARAYAEGLDHLRRFETQEARRLLAEAVAAEPGFAPAHAALAGAHLRLGYAQLGQDEAKRAFELSTGLGREERLVIEAGYRSATGDHAQAVEIDRALLRFFPDSLEYGVALVNELATAGKYADAVAVVEELQRMPPPANADPRVDLAEALVMRERDFPRKERAAARAAAGARARGDRELLGHALLIQADAVSMQGRQPEAERLDEEARRILLAIGDRSGVAGALFQLGVAHGKRWDSDTALAFHSQAIEIDRELGDVRAIAAPISGSATMLVRRGDYAAARRLREDALAYFRQSGARAAEGREMMNLASVIMQQGELSAAIKQEREAIAVLHEAGARATEALALRNLGGMLERSGNLAGAAAVEEQAVAIAREVGEKHDEAFAHRGLAFTLFDLGRNDDARREAELARTTGREVGDPETASAGGLILCALLLVEGHVAEAEPLARQLLTEMPAGNPMVVHVTEVLAWSLVGQGKLGALDEIVTLASAQRPKVKEAVFRIDLDATVAVVRAATGDTEGASRDLERLIAEASGPDFPPAGLLDLRRRLGEVEIHAGKSRQGHARLAAVEAEARKLGLVELARRAARQEPGFLLSAR